jgi:hypothetical protein
VVSIGDSDELQAEYRLCGPTNHGEFYGQWGNLAKESDEQFHIRAFDERRVTAYATAFHREIEHGSLAHVLVTHKGTRQFDMKARILPSVHRSTPLASMMEGVRR